MKSMLSLFAFLLLSMSMFAQVESNTQTKEETKETKATSAKDCSSAEIKACCKKAEGTTEASVKSVETKVASVVMTDDNAKKEEAKACCKKAEGTADASVKTVESKVASVVMTDKTAKKEETKACCSKEEAKACSKVADAKTEGEKKK